MFKTKLMLFALFLSLSSNVIAQSPSNATFIYELSGTFEEAVEKTRTAIASANYRVFPKRYLEQGFASEDEINKKQVTVRFCNFKNLHDALKLEPRLGVVLPCKLTIVEDEKGQVKLIAPNISGLALLFQNKELKPLEEFVKESYEEIIDEVTL